MTVTGTAEVEAEPDRATIRFEATASDPERKKAYDRVVRAQAALVRVLDAHEVPARDRQTASVFVYERRDPKRGEVRDHLASCTTTVRMQAADRIGELIDAAVREAGIQVSGPNWYVSREHPARTEAYREAARDAQGRAAAYAAGLGLELGPVVNAEEASSSFGPVMRSLAAPAAAVAEPIEVAPGTVQVSAGVRAVFELRRGEAVPG